ncbi:MAG: hypothetical protein HY300_20260 [Verrucomicrobia bacterium]|nr:hypothetical protein [Verrucomicrobiota bacterium]
MTDGHAFSAFISRLREFIRRCARDDHEFGALALELFRLQFFHNESYRTFCRARRIEQESVKCWQQIPAVPTSAFKELELTSLPADKSTTVFHSSGTTGQERSRHFHNTESLALYEASLLPWFQRHMLPMEGAVVQDRWPMLSLLPEREAIPDSSLAHMFATVSQAFSTKNLRYSGGRRVRDAWMIDSKRTIKWLRKATKKGAYYHRPVLVFGTAFSFVQFCDEEFAQQKAGNFESTMGLSLPAGSRVLETGGYKGRSREVSKSELREMIAYTFSVRQSHIISEYGMSELSSQAYDRVVRPEVISPPRTLRDIPRCFHFPPWARVQIISPETGCEVAEGETGLLRVFDLANVRSVLAVQTEDLAVRRGDGFELVGRGARAAPRGCSLMTA